MPKRFYPAVLERGDGDVFAIWFPDFPSCVAAGHTQDEAAARAEEALANAMREAAERNDALPAPTPFEDVVTPHDAQVVALLALGARPPDPSERVNVYLPRSLIEQADEVAARWSMSRSSFFGLALTRMLSSPYTLAGAWPKAEVERAKKKGRRP